MKRPTDQFLLSETMAAVSMQQPVVVSTNLVITPSWNVFKCFSIINNIDVNWGRLHLVPLIM